jgi:adhesin/invasin
VGTANITVNVGGNALGVNAASVTLRVVPAFSDVLVNGTNFGLNDGFPTTGFIGAEFTLNVTGLATDYNWSSSNPSWVNVDSNGKVSFIAEGNSTPVTITASLKTGGGDLTYPFTVRSWFINNGNNAMNWNDASIWCSNQGLTQPVVNNLTLGTDVRGMGSLWSEWGRMAAYPGSGFVTSNYWTADVSNLNSYFRVSLGNGSFAGNLNTNTILVVCSQEF